MRYPILDHIRGMALVSMIVYHLVWDLVHIAGVDWAWYKSDGAYIWQQSICWTFIILSGFCWSMGKNKVKRGIITFVAGMIITLITQIFVPESKIVFGILTFLGSCTLIFIPLEKILKKVPSGIGLSICMVIFILLKNMNNGEIGIGENIFFEIPSVLYKGYFMTYIGFTAPDFYSTDYFSLFPWFFLFVAGYFLYQMIYKGNQLRRLEKKGLRVIEYMGQHSLGIYLLHQPVIYLLLEGYLAMNS